MYSPLTTFVGALTVVATFRGVYVLFGHLEGLQGLFAFISNPPLQIFWTPSSTTVLEPVGGCAPEFPSAREVFTLTREILTPACLTCLAQGYPTPTFSFDIFHFLALHCVYFGNLVHHIHMIIITLAQYYGHFNWNPSLRLDGISSMKSCFIIQAKDQVFLSIFSLLIRANWRIRTKIFS